MANSCLPTFLKHPGAITMGLYDEINWSDSQTAPPRIDFYKAGLAIIKAAEDAAFEQIRNETKANRQEGEC